MQTDKMTKEQFKAHLESFIDSNSLKELANLISDVCDEKAAHIRENWQDERLAKTWEDASAVFYTDAEISLKDL